MSEEAEIAQRANQVQQLLARKDKVGALAAALQNPPVNSKSEELKNENAAIVERVLSNVSESDIPSLIANLSPETLDILMKYIYKLMEKASNCSLLLKLHAQVLDKAGHGSIIRVLTDRKTV
jgi:actin related protein 2/3 complex subunit 5